MLYYSLTDASKFRHLIQQQHVKHKDGEKRAERALEALSKMVEYAVRPSCRRVYLLRHFGETAPSTTCQKNCDFCKDPDKVQRAIGQAQTATGFSRFSVNQKAPAWDGQWEGPHGDDAVDDDYEDLTVGDLGITTAVPSEASIPLAGVQADRTAGFRTASAILDKYEVRTIEAVEHMCCRLAI